MDQLVRRYGFLVGLLTVNALASGISLLWHFAAPSKASDDGTLPGRTDTTYSNPTNVVNMCAPSGHCSEAPIFLDVAEITCTPLSEHEAAKLPEEAEHVSMGDRNVDQTGSAPCQNLDVSVNLNIPNAGAAQPAQQYFYE